ncbi:ribosomal protein S18 acetylase RimI-like enzyme [Pedobacter cryoconitis]|uniref:GNAT family N-acetyltransferase n=1 Tax=Pedobacter cryoconitis TaxID=188932 RepID=UPI00161F7180|nr:GNAT family N-acetyltransferase [Pedobacter cryoconitis]MBB6271873.1 ribosomal protein S18 acetylase RimI-like enzyme [Pedobacter cryoconitis]
MMEAQIEHKGRIVEILTHAFENNKSVLDIVGENKGSLLRLKYLIEYAVNVCGHYGRVMISDDQNACALVLFPDRLQMSFRYFYWNLKLLTQVIGFGNLRKVISREIRISDLHPKGEIYYLWFIGVLPDVQGKGLGSKLLVELIADAEFMERKICLETSTVKNLPWYRRYGFKAYHRLDDFGYPLYFFCC